MLGWLCTILRGTIGFGKIWAEGAPTETCLSAVFRVSKHHSGSVGSPPCCAVKSTVTFLSSLLLTDKYQELKGSLLGMEGS